MASTESKADVVRSLSADLAEEQQSLRRVLASITEAEWSRPTPAKNWTIQDQIAHLAHFDFVTRLAISQPERFIDVRGTMTDLQTYV
ncbi:MAG: maleylpyruvate isomerase N-terminal domain-containing protein, partial [Brevibacterium aurantiacum]